MREKLGIASFIVIISLFVIGFLALLALGIITVVGFAGANIPFGFAFLIAMVLIVAYAISSADFEVSAE